MFFASSILCVMCFLVDSLPSLPILSLPLLSFIFFFLPSPFSYFPFLTFLPIPSHIPSPFPFLILSHIIFSNSHFTCLFLPFNQHLSHKSIPFLNLLPLDPSSFPSLLYNPHTIPFLHSPFFLIHLPFLLPSPSLP